MVAFVTGGSGFIGGALTRLECTIDISKARRELGYAPVKSVEQGMAELRAA